MNILSRKRLEAALQYWNEHGAIIRGDGLIVGGMHLNFEPIDDDMSETVTMALEFLLTPTPTVEMWRAAMALRDDENENDPDYDEVFKAMISKMTEDTE